MAQDLEELRQRLIWCRTKSAELSDKIQTYREQSILHWIEIWQPGTGEIKAKMISPPSVALRTEIGVVVNEQRSILDALMCTLASRNGANDTRDVYFPICKDTEGLNADSRRKIRKISNEDRQKFESLKPWKDGHPYLFLLHEADRVRKHQKLLGWVCMGGVHPAGSGRIGHLQSGPVAFRVVDKIETLAFFSGVTCDLAVHIDLVYLEPHTVEGQQVVGCLHEFNNTVDEAIALFS